jgi:site-specific recombinase XerD
VEETAGRYIERLKQHRTLEAASQGAGRVTGDLLPSPLLPAPALPPILAGQCTPETRERVESFYFSVAAIFETWVKRRQSRHTRRAYREDVMAFVRFIGIRWPEQSVSLLTVSITDVQDFREALLATGAAPKTLNRRISSLSGFYKYLHGAAAELRLPITVPNPAHAQFIARESPDARDETKALSSARARQLMNLPSGESVLDYRDRAILKLYIYSGIRLTTGCRLKVEDFDLDEHQATIRIHEKGNKHRTIGLNHVAGLAIEEYIHRARLTSGPLFRPRRAPASEELAERAMGEVTMYRVILEYLKRVPGAMKEVTGKDGTPRQRCMYTPHSLRATNATLLLDGSTDIRKVQELLGHRHITTTQIYDKRRRGTSDSASHELVI